MSMNNNKSIFLRIFFLYNASNISKVFSFLNGGSKKIKSMFSLKLLFLTNLKKSILKISQSLSLATFFILSSKILITGS